MNQRQAKRLRRIARAYSVGKPERAVESSRRGVRLAKTCARGLYRSFKRSARNLREAA